MMLAEKPKRLIKNHRELSVIFFIVFLSLFGFGLVVPVLPFLALKYNATSFTLGALMATYSLFQFIGSPILGRLSDIYGRRPILAISLFGSFIGYILIAFSHSLSTIFLSRIIDGITGGNISVAQAYIADITYGKNRTKAMGLVGAAFALGFVLGPAIGGLLGHFSIIYPFLAGAFLSIIAIFIVYKYLPEPKKRVTSQNNAFFTKEAWLSVLKNRWLLVILLTNSIVTLAFSELEATVPLFAKDTVNWGAIHLGIFFAAMGIILALTQAFLLRRLVDKYDELMLAVVSGIVLSLSFILLSFSKHHSVIYLAGLLLAVSFGTFTTVLQGLISKLGDQDKQGTVLGVSQGLSSLARVIGPILGGYLYGIYYTLPFLTSGMIILGVVTVFLTINWARHNSWTNFKL